MSEVVLTPTERKAIRAACDDARQFDDVAAVVRQIISARLTSMGMTENHTGGHQCFACGLARATRPINEMMRRAREQAAYPRPAAPIQDPTP